jgi:hypothetical protein
MKKQLALLAVTCSLAMIAGCNNDGVQGADTGVGDTGPGTDGGTSDGGRDGGGSGSDGGRDAGIDMGTTTADTGVVDGGIDGGIDAGDVDGGASDAGGSDAGTDGGTVTADFRIDSLGTTGCVAIDVDDSIGDDHGGIAIAGDRVLLNGDNSGTPVTGIFPLDLSGPPAPPLVAAHRDIVVSDLATGTLYLLQDASGPLGYDGGSLPAMLTSLVVANDDLSAGTTTVTLSAPIALDYDAGIFAGSGEIGIYDGSHLWIITLATGAVQDAGALTVAHRTCETWAYWGVLEHVGTAHWLVVSAGGSDGVHRIDVATGTVTDLGGITEASDMCSLSVSTATNRWYFHSEGTTSFTTEFESIGYCDATIDTTGGNLQITTLASTGCMAIDVEDQIGDDHGGIAVTSSHVYLAGDEAAGRWALDLTDATFGGDTGRYPTVPVLNGMVTNLHDGTTWSLATATGLFDINAGGNMTSLVQIDATGAATSTVVTLSQPIALTDVTEFGGPAGMFAGWDEIAIYDGQTDPHVWLVSLPSGTVTDLGAMAAPPVEDSETWAIWGVVEHFGGEHYLVARSTSGADPTISRFLVPSGTETVISTFTDISDLATFVIGPTLDRWYFHHEFESELTGTDTPSETLGYCDAMITHP